ncbi:MAG: gliding motility protein GldL [Bacteroidales bacterium]|nr:gliding motility protein GldL [Bacteroidales bacterium]
MGKKKPFNETLGWKTFIAKLYGIGAGVVIIGALFKIQHYPGASIMLCFGLITEAIIFFFSAFDPLPVEYHWQNVYPELLEDADADEDAEPGEAVTPGAKKIGGRQNFAAVAAPQTDGKAFAELNKMIEECNGKNVFQSLGQNFANFNETVQNMKDVADSSVASKEFADSLKSASNSVQSASSAFSSINSTVEDVSSAMSSAQAQFAKAAELDFSQLADSNKKYSESITKLNGNLGAINDVFELQLNEIDFEKMISELKGSVQYAQQYSTEVSKLSKNLAALNTVYGNMLTALNVKMN